MRPEKRTTYIMANPFKGRPSTPDQIIDAPDLTPQARVVGSPYMAPTVRNVAEVPKENQLEMLGNALATISPDVQQAVGMISKKYNDSEVSRADSERLTNKNEGEYADLVRSGKIAPGQSRAYEDRYLTQEAKRHADAFQPALTEAWSTSGVSQLDAAPGAFDKFADTFAKQWNTDHLQRTGEDGVTIQKYSPKQLHDAQYAETQANTIANLRTHNSNVVIDQRSQKGFDVFAGNVQNFVKDAITNRSDGLPTEIYGRDFTQAAAKIKDLTHGPMGFYSAGMTNPKMNELTALGIMQAAVDTKDASVIDSMGHAIDAGRPDAPITGIQVWIKHATATKEHIASVTQTDRIHAEELLKVDALGKDPATREAYYKQVADNQKGVVTDALKSRIAHEQQGAVLNYEDVKHMTGDELLQQKVQLATLRKTDPELAMQTEHTLYTLRNPQALLDTAHHMAMTERDLSQMIDLAPASPSVTKAMGRALDEGRIDGAAYRRLQTDMEQRRNGGPLAKMLADPSVAKMLTSIEHGGVSHVDSITGQESQAGGLSRMDGERAVKSYLQKHPQADNMEVVQMLSKVMPSIVDSHNAVRVEEIAREKDQKRITDQLLKAEAQTKDIAKQDAQDATDRASIRAQYASKYPNEDQLNAVVSQVMSHRKKAKK